MAVGGFAGRLAAVAALAAVALVVPIADEARADPIPGFDLSPAELERRMDACLQFTVPKSEILMGWVNFRTGATRHWRCSSLIHMMLHAEDRIDNHVHDPCVNIPDFMRCADEVVSYGFPRPGAAGNTVLYKQYNGTDSRAIVVVNDATGDIATIYTEPRDNDWSGCANAL